MEELELELELARADGSVECGVGQEQLGNEEKVENNLEAVSEASATIALFFSTDAEQGLLFFLFPLESNNKLGFSN